MKRLLFPILLSGVILFSCDDSKQSKNDEAVDSENSESSDVDSSDSKNEPISDNKQTWQISDDGCLLATPGEPDPDLDDNFKVDFRVESRMEEGETYDVPKAFIFQNKELLVECEMDQQGDTAEISGLKIHSNRFKTEEGIGVGSTMEEFMSTYPEFRLWYTYVGDFITFDTPEYSSIQFHINRADYLPEEILFDTDMEILDPKDFKEDAEIAVVRIY